MDAQYTFEKINSIWKNCKEELVKIISPLYYSIYIEPLELADIVGDIAHFTIPFDFCINMLETKYYNDIKNTLIEATGKQLTLSFHLKGEYTPYKCSICGQEPFWNGQTLTLILDHVNGKNHDNRLENLRWVCPNCNQQLDTTGYKQMRVEQKPEKKYYCLHCGKEITRSSNSGLCIECSNLQSRVCERPSRQELKTLIRTTPFTKIGKMFGVSDNAIRKWCLAEKLPTKVNEIKKISDIDWELI